ncbi:unnamed protein product [Owenia fusiformis]|uniref:Uncharacterized protein n=1 Tax=Owenia fusiformis TaxID=6347 RepID=A0A8J1TC65_OWEFU|nr:unnamed protein product [Owenia fusiformis]
MSSYIDDDFVVHGRTTPMWEKPGHLSNSQLTTTTRRLTQNTLYSPDNKRDMRRSFDEKHLSDVANQLNNMSDSMRKSVSFSRNSTRRSYDNDKSVWSDNDSIDEELVRLIDRDNAEADVKPRNRAMKQLQSLKTKQSEQLINRSVSPYGSQWYTKPMHLTPEKFAYHDTSLSPQRSVSSPAFHRPTGSLGASLAIAELAKENATEYDLQDMNDQFEAYPVDMMEKAFFPVTLGASKVVRTKLEANGDIDHSPSRSMTFSPAPKRRPKSAGSRPPTGSRSQSTRSRMTPVDKMFLMNANTPTIKDAGVIPSSPYEYELAKLRMDRLRLEEDHLLELKRQAELERIRGPKPKWYEMKTPQFHYEANKNNTLIKSKSDWQALYDYRQELSRASQNFDKSYNKSLYEDY